MFFFDLLLALTICGDIFSHVPHTMVCIPNELASNEVRGQTYTSLVTGTFGCGVGITARVLPPL